MRPDAGKDHLLPYRPPPFDAKPKRLISRRTWILGGTVSVVMAFPMYELHRLGMPIQKLIVPASMMGIAVVTTWTLLIRRDIEEARTPAQARSPAPFHGRHGRVLFDQEGDRLVLRGFLGKRIAPNLEEASRLQKVAVRWLWLIALVPPTARFFFPHFAFVPEVAISIVLFAALTLYIHRETRDWKRS
jgi:hypothetical protein